MAKAASYYYWLAQLSDGRFVICHREGARFANASEALSHVLCHDSWSTWSAASLHVVVATGRGRVYVILDCASREATLILENLTLPSLAVETLGA